tara:strand:- start:877 stop:2781 length:1905 start_codon:yes stop_codon:yes gene_type:complete
MKKHWVMDYETLKNCFVGVFKHYKTNEIKIFVIHDLKNDLKEFLEFLSDNIKNREWHISYNGLAFDAQITHYIIDNAEYLMSIKPSEVTEILYKEAQAIIGRSNRREFQKYPEWRMRITQIDVFKLNHWDNMAKRSSLKWIEYTMDWDNILDMPIHHESEITTQEQLDTIVEYCINDVEATNEIYNRSKSLIGLRLNLSEQYDINLINASEPRISKELFSYYLSDDLGISKRDLKAMRTYRETIKLDGIILPYVNFKTPEFQMLLNRFKTVELDPTNIKGAFKYSVTYKGVKTHFGLGGAHGAARAGVYESDEEKIIMSSDVTSFYPNLAIKNEWSPAHLPSEQFCRLYNWFFTERKKIPKNDPMNYVYKIILNSTYGLSNDKNSFLYDPEFTMRITINGQLTLMMLYEMIMEAIPDAIPLLQNTDGIETIIPKSAEEEYLKVCARWERITDFNLEHDKYKKIVLADVNNYIAINTDGKAKCKGRFEFKNLALHKNKSKLVIPKAIYEYFVNDVLPEDYLKTNKNILDYCIGSKTNSGWQLTATGLKDGLKTEEKLQKINRYYVSNQGIKILKINKNDGRIIQLEAGQWLQTVFNKMEQQEWEKYNINIKYYMQTIEKEINNILGVSSNQLELF